MVYSQLTYEQVFGYHLQLEQERTKQLSTVPHINRSKSQSKRLECIIEASRMIREGLDGKTGEISNGNIYLGITQEQLLEKLSGKGLAQFDAMDYARKVLRFVVLQSGQSGLKYVFADESVLEVQKGSPNMPIERKKKTKKK